MAIRFESPVQMLRLLRGAPLSVLYGLWLAKTLGIGLVGNEWMERSTGYSDKPISQALALLEEYGLASHGRYGWTLTSGADQLPLMNLGLEVPDNNLSEPSNDGFDRAAQPELRAPVADGEGVSRRISESENFRLSSSSSLTNLDSRFNNLLPDSGSTESENFRLALEELDRAGIREPARSRLAGMAHISVELVRFHCETSQNSGQAIFRIEHNWKIKPGWAPAAESPAIQSDQEEDELDQEDNPAEEPENETWNQVLSLLGSELARNLFETWVLPLRPVGLNDLGDVYTVQAANDYGRKIVESRLARTIERNLSGLVGREIRLVVCV